MHHDNEDSVLYSNHISELISGQRPVVMGILNLTPDSFSDGDSHRSVSDAVDCARRMIDDGADIIDIGGESSRPGAKSISVEEERSRVIEVITRIAAEYTIPVSIDTTKSVIAREAVDAGASIINDISALRFDADMIHVVRDTNAYIILMHMQGTPLNMQNNPTYNDIVKDVSRFLAERAAFAVDAGIVPGKIIVDPGIGFGKTLAHNLSLLHSIARFHDLQYPVLVGASRKGLIGTVTGAPVTEREFGTAAIVAHCIENGITIHRVHNVRAMRQVCDMAAAIRNAQ